MSYLMSTFRSTVTCIQRIVTILAALQLLISTAHAVDDLTKPIKVSPNGQFLATPHGEPFFWLGDTGWSIFTRLTREEAEFYLRDRAEKGFTVVQAVAAGAPFDDLDVPNRYGELPFEGQDPSRPNRTYFEHVDWIVEKAASYGLRFALLPVWGNTQISKKELFSVSTAREYGRWIAQRYRGRGIIWVMGGDTNPVYPASIERGTLVSVVDRRPIYDAMATGIAEGSQEDPFITYHPTGLSFSGTPQPRTSLYLHDRPWLDMNMLQSSHFKDGVQFLKEKVGGADFVFDGTRNYEPVLLEYRSAPTRPVIDGEPRFEDLAIDLDDTGARGFWSGYDARNAAYHAVFAGAAGHTYGNHYLWQYYEGRDSPYAYEMPLKRLGWREALERPVSGQLQYLKSLMLSRPYFTRIPDSSLVQGEIREGTAYVSATRDQGGQYAMIYLPHGQPVTIKLSKLSGAKLIGWWYDPRTGTVTRVADRIRRTDTRIFTPPSSGRESDWVLVIDDESKGFAPPGRTELELSSRKLAWGRGKDVP
jgi:hypothetical protein